MARKKISKGNGFDVNKYVDIEKHDSDTINNNNNINSNINNDSNINSKVDSKHNSNINSNSDIDNSKVDVKSKSDSENKKKGHKQKKNVVDSLIPPKVKKKQKLVYLPSDMIDNLDKAGRMMGKGNGGASKIIELSLNEFFKNHDFNF